MNEPTLHEPRHAAAFDFHRNAAAITLARDYQPKHAVAVVYTGHGLSHGTYRPDVAL